jgi:hypothetical protein
MQRFLQEMLICHVVLWVLVGKRASAMRAHACARALYCICWEGRPFSSRINHQQVMWLVVKFEKVDSCDHSVHCNQMSKENTFVLQKCFDTKQFEFCHSVSCLRISEFSWIKCKWLVYFVYWRIQFGILRPLCRFQREWRSLGRTTSCMSKGIFGLLMFFLSIRIWCSSWHISEEQISL